MTNHIGEMETIYIIIPQNVCSENKLYNIIVKKIKNFYIDQ